MSTHTRTTQNSTHDTAYVSTRPSPGSDTSPDVRTSSDVRTAQSRRALGRGSAAAALTVTLTATLAAGSVLLAAPAAAHVTVNPSSAEAGDYSKLTFRVPNESDTAGTTSVAVTFPTDTPFASVSVKPHEGWTADVARTKLPEPVKSGDLEITEAVTKITWKAEQGVSIAPGQFDEFDVSVGPLPEGAESVAFPAVQTYDDGKVVSWSQPVPEGGEEPELPAPTLQLVAAQDAEAAEPVGQTGSGDAAEDGGAAVQAAGSSDASDGTARLLGTGGLVLGALGLGAGAGALLAARRRRSA